MRDVMPPGPTWIWVADHHRVPHKGGDLFDLVADGEHAMYLDELGAHVLGGARSSVTRQRDGAGSTPWRRRARRDVQRCGLNSALSGGVPSACGEGG